MVKNYKKRTNNYIFLKNDEKSDNIVAARCILQKKKKGEKLCIRKSQKKLWQL